MNITERILIESSDSVSETNLAALSASKGVITISEPISAETSVKFALLLKHLDAEEKELTILIDCPGGEVNAGLVIYDLIQAYPYGVDMYCIGLAATGSYIVTDPKGRLYRRYADYMRGQGYNVIHLDFIHTEKSDGFNPFYYAKKPDEIMKLASYITYSGKSVNSNADPFWDNCANLLLSGVIGYMEDDHYPAHKKKHIGNYKACFAD